MEKKTVSEIQEEYDLELERIIRTIKREKAEKVLLQFPDGLKPFSTTIADYLEKQLPNTGFFIWLGSCFGACDVPDVKESEIDLIVQFGHSKWDYGKESKIEVID